MRVATSRVMSSAGWPHATTPASSLNNKPEAAIPGNAVERGLELCQKLDIALRPSDLRLSVLNKALQIDLELFQLLGALASSTFGHAGAFSVKLVKSRGVARRRDRTDQRSGIALTTEKVIAPTNEEESHLPAKTHRTDREGRSHRLSKRLKDYRSD